MNVMFSWSCSVFVLPFPPVFPSSLIGCPALIVSACSPLPCVVCVCINSLCFPLSGASSSCPMQAFSALFMPFSSLFLSSRSHVFRFFDTFSLSFLPCKSEYLLVLPRCKFLFLERVIFFWFFYILVVFLFWVFFLLRVLIKRIVYLYFASGVAHLGFNPRSFVSQ